MGERMDTGFDCAEDLGEGLGGGGAEGVDEEEAGVVRGFGEVEALEEKRWC